ncbi:hypothetical protein VNO77_42110 [Canavalia gladiata]|uniref:Uncharacterized protein n=1 Tax=Canavalia gladiata TaxID=3824 RepID=A0AAN9K0G1_CANGL
MCCMWQPIDSRSHGLTINFWRLTMGVQIDYAKYISHHLFQKLWLDLLGFCDISGFCKIMQYVLLLASIQGANSCFLVIKEQYFGLRNCFEGDLYARRLNHLSTSSSISGNLFGSISFTSFLIRAPSRRSEEKPEKRGKVGEVGRSRQKIL